MNLQRLSGPQWAATWNHPAAATRDEMVTLRDNLWEDAMASDEGQAFTCAVRKRGHPIGFELEVDEPDGEGCRQVRYWLYEADGTIERHGLLVLVAP